MKLYKNVDIQDLDSILKSGIISLNKSNNDNWDSRNRAENTKDFVYLFNPKNKGDSFCQYGIALIEVEIEAERNEFAENDCNSELYEEFIVNEVPVSNIKNIYVPEIFKNTVKNENVTFCKIEANFYGDDDKEVASIELLNQFAKTTTLNSTDFNFFRGIDEKNCMIDLYDIKYVF